MADERVEIEIVLDDGSIQKGFLKVEQGAKKAGKSVESSFKQSFGFLRKEILALSGAFIGLFAGRAIINAAAQQEQAVTNLNSALRNAGSFSEKASLGFQKLATEIQRNTGIGDELILQQIALARVFANSNEQAEELVRAAVDLSAATGTSLDSAVQNLGKSLSGLTGQLGENVKSIRSLTKEQLLAGDAITLIRDKFDEFATRSSVTFTGSLRKAAAGFGDLLGAIGEFITKNPAVVSAINTFTGLLTSTTDALREIRAGNIPKIFDDIARGFRLATAAAISFFVVLKAPAAIAAFTFELNGLLFLIRAIPGALASARIGFALIVTVLKTKLVSALATARLSIVSFRTQIGLIPTVTGKAVFALRAFTGAIKASRLAVNLFKAAATLGLTIALDLLIEKFFQLKEEFGGFTNALSAGAKKIKISILEAFVGLSEELAQTGIGKFFGLDEALVGAKIRVQELKDELQSLRDQAAADAGGAIVPTPDDDVKGPGTPEDALGPIQTVGDGFSNFATGFKQQAKDLAKSSGSAFKEIGKSALNGLGNTAGKGFAAFGKALASGENGFKAFAGAILGGFAEVAIQLGTQFLLTGIAYKFSGLPEYEEKAGPLIAAGIALATFGGALSALGGGGGGGGASGGADTGSDSIASTEIGEELVEENITKVAINVEGTVLDPQTVGNQIAQILNDTFEAGGTRVVTA